MSGKVRAEPRAQGGYELDVERGSRAAGPGRSSYPITPKEHGVDFLMDHRHLWLRSRRQHAALRVRHEVIKAIRDFFDRHGFMLVDAPIFTPAACEGTTTLFEVDYFEDEKAYLTQSGQLYNEANAMAFGKVYCFGPTFRAEKSKTRRHLTEFWMVEPEVAYADSRRREAGSGRTVSPSSRVLDNRRKNSKPSNAIPPTGNCQGAVPPHELRRSGQAQLQARAAKSSWGGDFGGTDETLLAEDFDSPVIVDRYPTQIKAFYFQPDPERPEVALGVDMIAPDGYGEIIGGGQRIHDSALL